MAIDVALELTLLGVGGSDWKAGVRAVRSGPFDRAGMVGCKIAVGSSAAVSPAALVSECGFNAFISSPGHDETVCAGGHILELASS